jgi:hypothetical protein
MFLSLVGPILAHAKTYRPDFCVPIFLIRPALFRGLIRSIAPCLETPIPSQISRGLIALRSLSSIRSCSCLGRRTSFFWTTHRAELLNPAPNPLEGEMDCLGGVFQPAGEVAVGPPDCVERLVVAGTILPVHFVHRKDVMCVESSPVQFPQGQGSSRAPISVGEGMDFLESVVDDGRGNYGRSAVMANFGSYGMPPAYGLVKYESSYGSSGEDECLYSSASPSGSGT